MAQHVVLTGRLFSQAPRPAQPAPTEGAEAQAGGVSGQPLPQPPTAEATAGEAGPSTGTSTSADVAAAAAAAAGQPEVVAGAVAAAPEQAEERPAAPEAYRWEGKWYWSHTKNKQSTFAYEVSACMNA